MYEGYNFEKKIEDKNILEENLLKSLQMFKEQKKQIDGQQLDHIREEMKNCLNYINNVIPDQDYFLKKNFSKNKKIMNSSRKNGFYLVEEQEHLHKDSYEIKSGNRKTITDIFKEDIYFEIEKIIEKGLLKNKIYYIIKTEPFGWFVKRSFHDLKKIENILGRLFPFNFIDKIDTKNVDIYLNNISENKEILFINNYFKSLISNPYIKNSVEFHKFLSLDNKEYYKFVKSIEKEIFYPELKKFQDKKYNDCNEEFFFDIIRSQPSFKKTFTIQNSHFLNEFNIFLNKKFRNFKNIENNLLELTQKANLEIKNLKNTISEINKVSDDLNNFWKISDVFNLPYINNICNGYKNFSFLFKNFENTLNGQEKILNSELFEFLNYQKFKNEAFDMKLKESFILKKNLSNFEKSLSTVDPYLTKKKEDISFFRAFLNNSTENNFKEFFFHKNEKLHFYIEENFKEIMDVYLQNKNNCEYIFEFLEQQKSFITERDKIDNIILMSTSEINIPNID